MAKNNVNVRNLADLMMELASNLENPTDHARVYQIGIEIEEYGLSGDYNSLSDTAAAFVQQIETA